MEAQFENMKKNFSESRSFEMDDFTAALANLQSRLKKLTSFDDVSPITGDGTEEVSLVEILVLRDQAKLAAQSGKLARCSQLEALANFMLQQIVPSEYDYEASIDYLIGLGIPEPKTREWSMPKSDLELCTAALREHLDTTGPLTGIQVGNCFGVSLAWFANFIRSVDPESVLISVDPNYTIGGLYDNPQRTVIQLLQHFGLQKSNLMVTGYSLNRNEENWQPSCENLLPNLARIGVTQADFVLLDGWHDFDYTVREFREVAPLLRPGGVILVDDVEHLEGVRKAFDVVCNDGIFVNHGTPGRIGILTKI